MSPNVAVKACIAVVLGTVVLFGLWFYQAPYSTLMSIKDAAQRGDAVALNQMIDFPSFKSSIKILMTESVADSSEKGFGALFKRVLVGAIAGPVIDAMVTPESIVSMFSGTLPTKADRSPESNGGQGNDSANIVVTKTWDGLSVFRVRVQAIEHPADTVTFVLRREGLSWRLSALER